MCEEEFFYWKGTCDTSCEDISPRGLTTTLGIIAVILVWLILNKSAGGLYELSALKQWPGPPGSPGHKEAQKHTA